MKYLFESEWQGETNPGSYQGPEITPEGIVIDNSDEVTHMPETPEERKRRKKEKEKISHDAAAGEKMVVKEDMSVSLEDILNDPHFIAQLMAELNKYKAETNVQEELTRNLATILIEGYK